MSDVIITARADRPGLWARLCAQFVSVVDSPANPPRSWVEVDEIRRDTGLSVDEITGKGSHDPALPFFLQPGFERR